VRVACVSESYSVATLAAARDAARNPLLRAAHELVLRDETHHARFGWLFLDWLGDELDDAERARLAVAAGTQIDLIVASGAAGGQAGQREARRRLDQHVLPALARHGLRPAVEARQRPARQAQPMV